MLRPAPPVRGGFAGPDDRHDFCAPPRPTPTGSSCGQPLHRDVHLRRHAEFCVRPALSQLRDRTRGTVPRALVPGAADVGAEWRYLLPPA